MPGARHKGNNAEDAEGVLGGEFLDRKFVFKLPSAKMTWQRSDCG